jgi:dolichol-phosphate mannosyltransferase
MLSLRRVPAPAPEPERKLSVLIPVYNEERTIGEVLVRVCGVDTETHGFTKEIIVCDDGSADGTAAAVSARMAGDARIRLVRHGRNRGKGAAIRTALVAATGNACLIQDADLEYDVNEYPRILDALRAGAPVVYGSRFLTAAWPRGMQPANLVANKLLTAASNLLYGLAITDEATCYKAFDTALLRSLDLRCDGFDFCPEVTAKLGRRRVKVVEVPISYRARTVSEGKKIRWTDGWKALATLIAQRWR